MATSGSVDYNRTRDQIINGALRLCGVLGRGKTVSADDTADAAEALELMAKALQAKGLHLWKRADATLFMDKISTSYLLGPTSGAHATNNYRQTALSVAAATSATTVILASVTGIVTLDYIGVALDNNTMHWTQVNGAPSGNVVTLSVALPSAAAAGKTVFAYTTKMPRPLKIIKAMRVEGTTETTETPIDVTSEDEYLNLNLKAATGKVNQVHYRPTLQDGRLFVWPVGDTVTDRIRLTYESPIEDFDTASNSPDFPQEWLESLKFMLAARIAPEYGIPRPKQDWLDEKAEEKMNDMLDWDSEEGPIMFGVDVDHG